MSVTDELREYSRVNECKSYGKLLTDIADRIDKNVDQLKAENAKLRNDLEDQEAYDQMLRDERRQERELYVKAKKENAKLRELVDDMWFWGYQGYMSSENPEWQMQHIDRVLDLMRELGAKTDR